MLDTKSGRVRFRCAGCGLCCGTPPNVMLAELLDQSKNFVLGALLRIISSPDPENEEDIKIMAGSYPYLPVREDEGLKTRLAAHMRKIAETQGVPIEHSTCEGSDIRIAFSMIDVDQLGDGCPQRTPEGGCAIYETRPDKCRVVPLDETVPASDAGLELATQIEYLVSHGGDCDTGLSAPILWKDGEIIDQEARDLHARTGIGMDKDFADVSRAVVNEYLDYKAEETGLGRETVENVIEQMAAQGEWPIFSLVPALARCITEGVLNYGDAIEVMEDQIKLIEERLPYIDPSEPIAGVVDSTMLKTLEGWRDTYRFISEAWSRFA